MTEKRLALLIASYQYQDPGLSQLVAPPKDVAALAEVLQDPAIGGFDEVQPLINEPLSTVRRTIARFYHRKRKNDLLLLYFSGHGVLDDWGRLYLTVTDTELEFPGATAIPATDISDEMDKSRSRRKVLILDCCHSGAFERTKGVPGARVGTAGTFEGNGFGRFVLTASDVTQYALDGDQAIGEPEHSVFTHYLVQGLRTGEADIDGDGQVTLDEWYDYAYEQVVSQTPKQTPGKWNYKRQGDLIIARTPEGISDNPNPVVKPAELLPELRSSIEDLRPWVREGAVRELGQLLQSNEKELALAAQEALKHLANDDSRSVSAAAAEALGRVTDLALAAVEVSNPSSEAKPRPSIPDVLAISSPIELELVRVPAGEFLMGSDPDTDKYADDNEQPQHTVFLPDYYVARTPVTNSQYAAFVQATGYQTIAEKEGWGWGWTGKKWDEISGVNWRHPRGPDSDISDKTDHPVVQVSWAGAVAFCRWLSQETGQTFRMPTEAEWEKAARGTDGWLYPWGNEWDKTRLNSREDGVGDTTPASRYSPQGDSPYGAADMAGNIWEWCATKEGKSYPYDTVEDEWSSDYLAEPGVRVLRGGSWDSLQDDARCACRIRDENLFRYSLVGFRVVVFPNR
jgi:formylglycine-generating enzyme required for sulfatase activity